MVAPQQLPPHGRRSASRFEPAAKRSFIPRSALPVSSLANTGIRERTLSITQIDAIRAVMKLFVDDDVARGVGAFGRVYCDGCEQPRPAAGGIHYDRYLLCNGCAIEYEVARARGLITTPGKYVRDKHFGDGDLYLLVDV